MTFTFSGDLAHITGGTPWSDLTVELMLDNAPAVPSGGVVHGHNAQVQTALDGTFAFTDLPDEPLYRWLFVVTFPTAQLIGGRSTHRLAVRFYSPGDGSTVDLAAVMAAQPPPLPPGGGGFVLEADFEAHTTDVSNPHSVTAAQVGLGSVDNTSDANKPVSIAQQAALDTKIDEPAATPVAGDLLRFDGSSWSTMSTRLFEGVGFPEGVVAAPVGSRYIDTAATAGAVEWIKASGTGSTGWQVAYGDTGLLNVASLVDTRGDGIAHSAYLSRSGGWVDLWLDITSPSDTTSPWTVLELPPGFRVSFNRLGALYPYTEAITTSTGVFSNGNVNLYSFNAGARDRFNGSWPADTSTPWPTTLPA